MIDGLIYELIGTDAAAFEVVPATGQILTQEKLDYEIKKEYRFKVEATDPWGLSDTMDLTIEVQNLTEVPIPLEVGGEESHPHEENAEDNTVGEYTAIGNRGKAVAWSLDGADSSQFMLDSEDTSTTLKFRNAPNYEMPTDSDGDNEYMVTVQAKVGSQTAFRHVKVTVTDVEEIGTLSATGTPSTYPENGTGDLGTYTLSGTAADDANWSLGGADGEDGSDQFMLEGTGTSRTLKFMSASGPDYEMPTDSDGDNEYMVTVQAEADGEMATVPVTITVTNMNELGALAGDASPPYAEDRTDAVETYTVSGGTMDDSATWTLDGADDDAFDITGGVLTFKTAPDYESPMGGANDDSNTYMVTVMAEAGGEMEMVEVTITVDNVEEAGTVTLDPARPSVGTAITATLADDDIVKGTVMWQWASADAMAGTFTNISDANSATYTPVDDDAGMYLRATADYTGRLRHRHR